MTKRISLTKIAYERHPVSLERKRELNAKGFKIIDAVFAPARDPLDHDGDGRKGGSLPKDQRPPKTGLGTDSGDQFSDEQLRAIIEQETGEKVHHKTGREKLVARFNELNAKAAAEV